MDAHLLSPAKYSKVERSQLLHRLSQISPSGSLLQQGFITLQQLPRSGNPTADVEPYITISALCLILYTQGDAEARRV